jgi:hypothetical protein
MRVSIDGDLQVATDVASDPAPILAAMKASGITGRADIMAKLDQARDDIQDATTLAQLLPPLKLIMRFMILQLKHGGFKVL